MLIVLALTVTLAWLWLWLSYDLDTCIALLACYQPFYLFLFIMQRGTLLFLGQGNSLAPASRWTIMYDIHTLLARIRTQLPYLYHTLHEFLSSTGNLIYTMYYMDKVTITAKGMQVFKGKKRLDQDLAQ